MMVDQADHVDDENAVLVDEDGGGVVMMVVW